ncbi:amyloid beta A4 precursor protein-binding family B member 1-interacting protein-like [Gorilla gorilla gorilla]|uniref:amyloid beta A4 precursor protein-binding family B member 1-interacting protein-like n=1 Tax=Gorilla gorilla gorilla TaxID=9595 RepID=UPI0008F4EA73|nr:amyloid beta A4 precursor protein-binding family B member 1-interacting protein-like [Gorilla gorilla gorilla]XP_055209305.1 amyloid beta A4 precursor protein-binding family B member 1-interacting protein-like [Gorilla gorilla gorilla]XP_055209306.1 amyloid beta A4 precursor protein-binding family B member 1-interacting protein-like [Gorilla gorilla gorilla]
MSQALCQKDKLKGPIKGITKPNGQMPQAAHSVSAVLEKAQTHAETWKDKKPALGNRQEHPGPRTAPSPACPASSGAEVLGHQQQPRHAPQGQEHRRQGLPRPARLLPAATATTPGRPRAPAAPGLRAPSPRSGQEASYAPPPQETRSINVRKQQVNKINA